MDFYELATALTDIAQDIGAEYYVDAEGKTRMGLLPEQLATMAKVLLAAAEMVEKPE